MALVAVPSTRWATTLGPIDGVEYLPWDMASLPQRAAQVEVVVPPVPTPHQGLYRLGELPRLRVIQLLTAGYEAVEPHLPPRVTLCNAAGVHDDATAELALTLILAMQRGLPAFVLGQAAGEWIDVPPQPGLADRRVLIIGYGRIGRAITARLLPFAASVTAVASRPRDGDELVETVHGIDGVRGLLPEHDIVVVVTPLTPATTRLVDADFLAAMASGALLVNVGRGGLVDTAALVEACAAGQVRAALDVTDPEPLPPGHPLFATPGVLISPHVGGASEAFYPRAVRLVRDQLRAYATGAPLDNVVRVCE